MNYLSQIFCGFQAPLFVAISLLGIGFLITFHELGHFLFCKLFNIKTPSFSIGFGPKLLEKKIGETTFSLSAIPMGGYVEIAGAAEPGQGDQSHANSRAHDSFAVKPYYQKMFVIFGGITFNLFFALFALSCLYYFGMPQSPLLALKHGKTILNNITPGSPAEKAGLKSQDKIISINNNNLNNSITNLLASVAKLPNQEAEFLIERNGQTQNIKVLIGEQQRGSKKVGYLGVDFVIEDLKNLGLISSIKSGISLTWFLVTQTFMSFKNMLASKSADGVSGPIGVVSNMFTACKHGLGQFLLILAMISIGLAVLNLIPIPILDGGQALIYTIEALIRRELPENLKYYVQLSCWLAFIALFLFISYKDLLALLKPYLTKFMGQ